MSDWTRIYTRMPDELKRLVDEQVRRRGITQSEFVREALIIALGWHGALDAVEDGHHTDDLRDPVVIARLLGRRE